MQEGELAWGVGVLVECAGRTREDRLVSHTSRTTWWDLVFVAEFISLVGVG